MLSTNRDVLQSKLELEAQLKVEQRRLREVLEGKGNGVLRDKISHLEARVQELMAKDKEVKTKERMERKKAEEERVQVEAMKREVAGRVEGERRRYEEKIDKLKLELTESWLSVSELRREVKMWREKYEQIREGTE